MRFRNSHRMRPAGCSDHGKPAYGTKAIARQAAVLSGRKRGVTLYVYKCDACRLWHLTSQPPRAAK